MLRHACGRWLAGRRFEGRRQAPLLLLLLALATLFPFFNEAGPLYRAYHELDHLTFNHLTIAKNLSMEHDWLGFYVRRLDADGDLAYEVYNRFPPLGYGLIKLAISTQPGDLAAQLQAARMLMMALYAGAALLAHLSLVQVLGRRWLALAATLTAFGSYAALRAADMVATDGTVDLFGTMLAFHGIAVYHRRPDRGPWPASPRLGQLAAKLCVALLLGWHVYALVAPFLCLGLAAALAARNWAELRRLLVLGSLALLFGLAVLAHNFAREYYALNGETALWDLPSARSMLRRAGAGNLFGTNWPAFLVDQLHRIGLALVPYAVTRVDVQWPGWSLLGGLGLAAIAFAGVVLARRKNDAGRHAVLVLVPLALVGCCWTMGLPTATVAYRAGLPPPGVDYADIYFESMFHVGVPLALFSLLALLSSGTLRRRRTLVRQGAPRAAAAGLVVAACVAFVASAFHASRFQRDPEAASTLRVLLADGDRIRRVAAGRNILAPHPTRLGGKRLGGKPFVRRLLFAGHVLATGGVANEHAELVAAPGIPGAHTLTPHNRLLFLYDVAEVRALRGAGTQHEGIDRRSPGTASDPKSR